MLGIRLSSEAEDRLSRHAREAGRPKSVVARDWIMERLQREEIDGLIRQAAALHRPETAGASDGRDDAATSAWLRSLDAEDGGYDWGDDGPPAPSDGR